VLLLLLREKQESEDVTPRPCDNIRQRRPAFRHVRFVQEQFDGHEKISSSVFSFDSYGAGIPAH
jgi:hypothetical protein